MRGINEHKTEGGAWSDDCCFILRGSLYKGRQELPAYLNNLFIFQLV
jgi:hypothetical protein